MSEGTTTTMLVEASSEFRKICIKTLIHFRETYKIGLQNVHMTQTEGVKEAKNTAETFQIRQRSYQRVTRTQAEFRPWERKTEENGHEQMKSVPGDKATRYQESSTWRIMGAIRGGVLCNTQRIKSQKVQPRYAERREDTVCTDSGIHWAAGKLISCWLA